MNKLIITEKHSVAAAFGDAFGIKEKNDGYITLNNGYLVTWCNGHLFKIDTDYHTKKDSIFPYFPDNFKYINSSPIASKQFAIIKNLLKNTGELINAGDAGQEGELIVRLILNEIKWKKWNKTFRLWTSEALTPEIIKVEMNNLKPINKYDSLYYAGFARQHADWLFGINMSSSLIRKMHSGNWSIGRVQTPVLAWIVQRTIERQNFKPKEYYTITVKFDTFSASLKEEEKLNKEQAEDIFKKIINKPYKVLSVVKKTVKQKPPVLYSLLTLQKDANKIYNFTAAYTLELAQKLYEEYKILSYPRTDSNYLGEGNKDLIKNILNKLKHKELISAVNNNTIFDNSKLSDHHALIPLAEQNDSISKDESKIFELVKKRFLAVFMDDYIFDTTNVSLDNSGYIFNAAGKIDKSLGWKSLYGADKDNVLPNLKVNDLLEGKPEMNQKFTTAPPAYTERALLEKMDSNNLGTPATQSSIIEKLKIRKYVDIEKNSIIASEKALSLFKYIGAFNFVSPEMSGKWEKELQNINKKQLNEKGYANFINNIKEYVKKSLDELNKISIVNNATPKMIEYAKKLAVINKVDFNLTVFDEVKEFISKYAPDNNGKATEPMLKFAKSLADKKGITLKDDSYEYIKKFLNANSGEVKNGTKVKRNNSKSKKRSK